MDFLSSVPHGKRELRIDLAEPRLLGNFDSEAICLWCCKMLRSTSQNGSIMLSHCWLLKIYILELCVSSVSELYQWYSTWNPRSQVIQKMSPYETFRQLMILQSLQSLGQPRGCEKILPMPSIDFSLESGIPSWDGTKYSKSLGNLCLGKRLTLLSSHMRLSIVMGVPQ